MIKGNESDVADIVFLGSGPERVKIPLIDIVFSTEKLLIML